eukprot:scaffold7408_cov32-Phaeocystis_antarctica.AAC.1
MYGIHPLGAGRGTHHVGEAHEELRNTILKTNSTFNNNSWRGPEVTSMRSSRPAGSRRAPCACRRRERERREARKSSSRFPVRARPLFRSIYKAAASEENLEVTCLGEGVYCLGGWAEPTGGQMGRVGKARDLDASTETAMLVAGIRESNENVIRRRLACVWLTYQGYLPYNI